MVGIYVNLTRDVGAVNANKFAALLVERGLEYRMLNDENGVTVGSEEYCRMDMLVVFGGDGTVLQAFKLLNGCDVPIIGVNAGNLGFLTEVDISEMKILADAIQSQNYIVESRDTLAVAYGDKTYYAVNDCALSRGSGTHTIRVELRIDGEFADKVSGDGMLVSTPTGSTAYALSCGGPILNPDVEAFVVIAVCPHTLHSRPMVISDKSEVELIADNTNGNLALSIDGSAELIEGRGEIRIKVKTSERKIKFVRIKEGNFYNKLINKLNYWNSTDREN